MVKDIDKINQRVVVLLVAGVSQFGKVQRHRALCAPDPQAKKLQLDFVILLADGGDFTRRKGHGGHLPQPKTLLRGQQGFAGGRQLRRAGGNRAHRADKTRFPGLIVIKPGVDGFHNAPRLPGRAFQRAIKPRCMECSSVSVKILIAACRAR
ncbi:Uncharacterised protein [Enterobacter cancerogenus]|uniref:Uncharacterized protein n=1 Tax=Enterobacter cancerogenus TaxID=69218 RepID=A0A484XNR3_9ENTR|nr:Uncharacterised protein [Enterobacter cancerogenus]